MSTQISPRGATGQHGWAVAILAATTLCVPLALAGAPAPAMAQEEPIGQAVAPDSAARDTVGGDPAARSAAQAGGLLADELLEPFTFRLIGPANQAGRVTAIAVPEGTGGKTAYVGFAGSGVWKTANHGVTWTPIFDDQPFTSIGDVAVAPSDPEVVWVGTGERNSLRSNGWGDGVYRSTDGGKTWEHRGLEQTRETGRIVIHPEDPDVVWVAAMGHLWGANPERGVYRTTDGGESWERVLFVDDTTGFVDLKMDPRDPDVLYAAGWHRIRWGGGHMEGAGAGSGIWKTTDGGHRWTRLDDPAGSRGLPASGRMGRIGIGIAPSDPDRLYAVIQDASSAYSPAVSITGGVYRSDDGGESWYQAHDVSAIPDYYYNEVWIDPNDPDRVYLAGTFLALTEDGGKHFENVDLGRVHVDHHALWIDPADTDHMILGNDGGVYVSWDRGEAWEHIPMPVGQFYEVGVDSTKIPYHVCGGTQDNGTWCGPSRTRERAGITTHDWYSVYGGDGFVSAVSVDSPRILYAESQYGNIGRRDTQTWETVPLQPHSEDAGWLSGYPFRWDWNTPFVLSAHDPRTLYLGGNHLFRLRDRGRRWEVLGPDMTRGNRYDPEPDSAHTSYRSLHSIAESWLDADRLWTGSNDGLIWTSADRGETWTRVNDNIPAVDVQHCFVAEIEASHHEPERAYVVHDCHRRDDYRPYVFRTDDAGRSWTDITGDLPDDAGSWVVRESWVSPDVLFVGNERGVYVTIDGGRHWTRLENGLPTVGVRDMNFAYEAEELVVGTFGRSIHVLDIGALHRLSPA
nr:glycosyl hydrolase [Gemmatimonadota bacterium]NIQ52269.1 glycosyl hydrolase [Gemmatimonadota bacterium]NIX44333.1 glycosyl hydrolase [Gemmatimonadota bacterium]NIY08549.1 glycosyl hydrolase [Gemmatimonadota bacterium]